MRKLIIIMPVAEQRGGAEITLLHLLQFAQGTEDPAAGAVKFHVVFLTPGPMVMQVQAFGHLVSVISAGRLRQPIRYGMTVLRIARLARREGADAIISWMPKAHFYGGPASILARVPSLWFQHNVRSEPTLLDHVITRLPARGVLACSESAARAQARIRPSLPVRVVYPGVDLSNFDPSRLPTPAGAREMLGLPPHGPIIGMVGRLQRSKGMHVLLEAMPQILRSHSTAHCVIVGGRHELEADYLDYLEAQIDALGLRDRVTLADLQANIPMWMQAMDVVVNATDVEGFGLVIVEAMALGKPTVVGTVGGATEIVTDDVTGIMTPYGESNALARAINRYLDNPDYALRIGAAARTRAQEFSTTRYAQQCLKSISDLLGTVPSRAGTRPE